MSLIGTKSIMGGAQIKGRQRGLVLIVVLIVLTAMMFAGIALMRSVDTSTLVAGNMAFRQAAVHQGDFGTEAAVAWLQNNNTGTTLQANNYSAGYVANLAGPTVSTGETWDTYWNTVLDTSPVTRPVTAANGVNSGNVWTLKTTPQGYTVSYVIHRMCPNTTGVTGCALSPTGSVAGSNSNKGGNTANFTLPGQIYYRITSRIEGPHNTVAYTQAMVGL